MSPDRPVFNSKKDTAFAPKPRPSSWRVPLKIKARDSRRFSRGGVSDILGKRRRSRPKATSFSTRMHWLPLKQHAICKKVFIHSEAFTKRQQQSVHCDNDLSQGSIHLEPGMACTKLGSFAAHRQVALHPKIHHRSS